MDVKEEEDDELLLLPKHPFRAIIVGRSGSGKTVLTLTTWHANDVEDFLPSTTIEELMEEEEEEEEETGVPLRRAGSVCGRGHTRFRNED